MQTLLDYFDVLGKGNGREKAIIAILSIVAGFSGALSILLINIALDEGYKASFFLMSAFVMVAAFSVFAKRMAIRKMRAFLEEHIAGIRLDLTSGIKDADFSFVEQLERGEAVTKMTIDARRISRTGDIIVKAYYSIFILLFTLVYLGWISLLALFLFIALFVVGVLFVRFYNKYVSEMIDKAAVEEEALFEGVEHLIGGFKELKLDRIKNSDFFENKLLPLVSRIRNLRKKALYRLMQSESVLETIWLSFIGFFFLLNDASDTGIQVLVIFLFLEGPIADIIVSIPFFVEANVATRRIEKLQDEVARQKSRARPAEISELPPAFDTLKVRDLCFNYTDKQGQPTYSFGPVSFDIKRHEITYIIGGNGAGKSTFLKLLLGLYSPFSGYFAADDKKIRMHEQGHWFSAIFSDCYLLDGLYGLEAVDETKLRFLIDDMGLFSDTSWREERFTNINLSSEQKKRLAMVISFMEDKPICVFDEWAAEQDVAFRTRFYEEILPELKARGKTVIIVSHDDRYFHWADHLIRLDYGKVTKDFLV
ncbi:MAG: putative ATP-binding cassette transporter [Candidatus Kentron sp. G]|nr:MAG: putative ATP-binding cassette transporter [Candidatus Kentron sp. G]